MKNNKATVSLFLDTRRANKHSEYPVKYTVYHNGVKKRYGSGISLTQSDWEKMNTSNLRDNNLKKIQRKLFKGRQTIEDKIDAMLSFDFTKFESEYLQKKQSKLSLQLSDKFEDYIELLISRGQVGTAISYRTTKNSINNYESNLKVTDVDQEFLREYEHYLKSLGRSSSTIGIYLRQLRRIINVAIKDGLYPADKYPFKGFEIPNSRNIKKALNEDQIKLLLNHKPTAKDLQLGLDFWIFSYLSNGINMTDVCLLGKESIGDNFFHYYRAKTRNTKKRDLRPIKVPLLPRSKEIIERWKNRDELSPYVFPVLMPGLTPMQQKYKIQDFIFKINAAMKKVAQDLKINQPVGTYVARHTHATVLKRKGAPSEIIKENLGHSSLLVTENYLADFTDDTKINYAKLLTDF